MTYHHGWLYVAEENGYYRELFNHARTAAYLQSSSALGCGTVSAVLDDGGCEGYTWVPPETLGSSVLTDIDGNILTDLDGNILVGAELQAPNGWYRETYLDPVSDPAPWYNEAFPESGQALGFWVSEWTGLDSGHIRRELTQLGGYGGGGAFGATSSSAREMGFEVILLGESEAALDYLYRWLDATISSVCATCATDTMVFRRVCPTIDPGDYDTAADGVVEMRGVGMMAGLQWGASPVESAGCYLRRVNFTLAATDPCLYGFCTDIEISRQFSWEECFASVYVDADRVTCRPSCSELPAACRAAFDWSIDDPSGGAPVIELVPPIGSGETLPVRVRTYANPFGLGVDELCGAPLLGELYVTSLPEWTELRYDVARRRIEIRNAGTGGWINGFAYVGPNTVGVPRFFMAGCGDYTTVIEPADLCYSITPADFPALNAVMYDLEQGSAGSVVVVGNSSVANGVAVGGVARYGEDGSLDTSFNSGTSPGVDSVTSVYASAVQPDGKILIGGAFTTARGVIQNYIARLSSSGALDAGFNVGANVGTNGAVWAVALQPDGSVVIGGDFTTARNVTQNRIARLDADGAIDATFNTGGTVGVSGTVYAIAIQPDGKILIGGTFPTARGVTQNRIARLNANGSLDVNFNVGSNVGVNGLVQAIAIQPDGKILIGGAFTTARGVIQNNIARLNADGSLDVNFNVGTTVGADGTVHSIAIQPDGKIVIGGAFTTARGVIQNNIARLNADGSLDVNFNVGSTVGVNSTVRSISVEDSGRILLVGQFTVARGVAVSRLVRLQPDGTVDGSFGGTTLGVYSMAPISSTSTRVRMGCA